MTGPKHVDQKEKGTPMNDDERAKLQEREALIENLRPLTEGDGWGIVTSGQVSVDDFVADAERLFTISPDRDLWGYVTVAARKAARYSWATSSTNLSDQPWTKIAERLMVFGTARGWELTDEDWE